MSRLEREVFYKSTIERFMSTKLPDKSENMVFLSQSEDDIDYTFTIAVSSNGYEMSIPESNKIQQM